MQREKTKGIYGKLGSNARDAIWYARSCNLGVPIYRTTKTSYGSPHTNAGIDNLPPCYEMPSWMMNMLDELSKTKALPPFNHVVMHRYIDGNDTIGFHHDKTTDIAFHSTIAIISFGGTRTLAFKNPIKDTTTNKFVHNKIVKEFKMKNGDIVLIPYKMNRIFKHSIKKERTDKVRYSITARTIDSYLNTQQTMITHRNGCFLINTN